MNEARLKNILRAKFELTQTMIGFLPENLQQRVHKVQRECMVSVREVLDSLLEESGGEVVGGGSQSMRRSQGVTKVTIE